MSKLERNLNPQMDVNPQSVMIKQATVDRAKDSLVDWLRDVKGPKGKRSMATILAHWEDRFASQIINMAVVQLIEENRVTCQRDHQVVGKSFQNPETTNNILSRCSKKDWIEYNRFPRKTLSPESSAQPPDEQTAAAAASEAAASPASTAPDEDVPEIEQNCSAAAFAASADSCSLAPTDASADTSAALYGGACSHSHPYPCIDMGVFKSRVEGKWSKGQHSKGLDPQRTIERDSDALAGDYGKFARKNAFRDPIREASRPEDEQPSDIE